MNTVTINNKQFPVIEYRGQRVVTLAMIDEVHQRPDGTAGRNFRENKSRLIEGEDYFELGSDEIRRHLPDGTFSKFAAAGIVLVESGYLMLVKSFTDDLAWQVQRELVNSYFRTHAPLTEMEMIAAMAADAVRQQKRLSHVEKKIETVTKAVENIKRGTMRAGYVGYRQVVAKSGMSDAKCRNLVNAY
ncbi:ORF6N domain-containing protein, partial [Escherichia coli O124]|nr:ORF6N domain-containing protein [Escherichia coli O124]